MTALTGLAYDGVLSLTEDRQGNLWVGTSEGLSRLVLRKITQITDLGLVTGVDVNRDGQIWVGTVDELMRFSESNLQAPIERVPLRATRLRTMHANRDTLWAATDGYVGTLSGAGARTDARRSERTVEPGRRDDDRSRRQPLALRQRAAASEMVALDASRRYRCPRHSTVTASSKCTVTGADESGCRWTTAESAMSSTVSSRCSEPTTGTKPAPAARSTRIATAPSGSPARRVSAASRAGGSRR